MTGSETPVWVQLVVPALTAVCGALAGLVAALYQSYRTTRRKESSERAQVRFAYLDPLRIAAENFAWKYFSVDRKVRERAPGPGGFEWMLRMFHWVKEPTGIHGRAPTAAEHGWWCNGEGFFAVSTVYATAVYLLHATRARRYCASDLELMTRLDGVRLALGHEYGIYTMLQDSIGAYVGDDDETEIGYRTFCTRLYAEEERLWFLNVLDYYRDIHRKLPEQRAGIMVALHELLAHLQEATGIAVHDPAVSRKPLT